MTSRNLIQRPQRLVTALLWSASLIGGCSGDGGKEDRPELHSWVHIYGEPPQPPGPRSSNASSLRSAGFNGSDIGTVSNALVVDTVRIGMGFDSAKEEWLSNCVEDAGLDTITGGNSQQVHYDVSIIKDLEEVATRFGVGIKASLGFGDLFSGGGEFRLAQDAKLNKYSTHIVAEVQVEQQAKSINKYLLKPWVLDNLKSDPNYVSSGKFAAKCGNGFASGFKTGGELIVLISRTNDSAEDKLTLETALNAKVSSLFSAEASARAEIMKTLGLDRTKFFVYSQGAVALLPDPENFLERAAKFPNEVAQSGGWPIAVRVTPYTLVENFPDLDSPRNEHVSRVLKEMADYRKAILPIHNDNWYIALHKAQFDLDDASHSESLTATQALLKAIEKAAIDCYEDGRCEAPTLTSLPRNPAPTKTPSPTEYKAIWQISQNECQLPGQVANCLVAGVSDECKKGQQTCSRSGDGSWKWSACLPFDERICLPDGATKDCFTGPYNCPGTQRFSRGSGWGQCISKMECKCSPGDTRAKTCANGASARDTCGATYDWVSGSCPAIPEVCDGVDNDLDGEIDELPECHLVQFNFSNVNDEALVWLDNTEGDNNNKAVCRIRGHVPVAGSCNLSDIMAARGNPNNARFIVKFLNSGCFDSSGYESLTIDNVYNTTPPTTTHNPPTHTYNLDHGAVHCGYVFRQVIDIDFAHGTSTTIAERKCDLPTDCLY